MKASEVLKKALEMFGPNGEKWVNRPPSFGQHCSLTAIETVTWPNGPFALCVYALKHVIAEKNIAAWNDKPERTFLEVKTAFEQAIKNCEATGR